MDKKKAEVILNKSNLFNKSTNTLEDSHDVDNGNENIEGKKEKELRISQILQKKKEQTLPGPGIVYIFYVFT